MNWFYFLGSGILDPSIPPAVLAQLPNIPGVWGALLARSYPTGSFAHDIDIQAMSDCGAVVMRALNPDPIYQERDGTGVHTAAAIKAIEDFNSGHRIEVIFVDKAAWSLALISFDRFD